MEKEAEYLHCAVVIVNGSTQHRIYKLLLFFTNKALNINNDLLEKVPRLKLTNAVKLE